MLRYGSVGFKQFDIVVGPDYECSHADHIHGDRLAYVSVSSPPDAALPVPDWRTPSLFKLLQPAEDGTLDLRASTLDTGTAPDGLYEV